MPVEHDGSKKETVKTWIDSKLRKASVFILIPSLVYSITLIIILWGEDEGWAFLIFSLPFLVLFQIIAYLLWKHPDKIVTAIVLIAITLVGGVISFYLGVIALMFFLQRLL